MPGTINWLHPLNKGLKSWHLIIPSWSGGTIFKDLTKRFDASFVNTPSWISSIPIRPGGFGGSLNFTRSTTDHCKVSKTVVDDTPVTLSCWVRFKDVTQFHLFLAVADEGTGNNFFSLAMLGQVAGDPWQLLRVAGTGETVVLQIGTALANQWYHVVATANKADIDLYIDGIHLGGNSGNNVNIATMDNLVIGGRQTTSLLTVDGYLDDVRAYDRQLHDHEVNQLYHLSRNGNKDLLFSQSINFLRPSTFGESLTFNYNLNKVLDPQFDYAPNISEIIELSDSEDRKITFPKSLDNTLELSDSEDRKIIFPKSLDNTFELSDSEDRKITFPKSLDNTLELSDSEDRNIIFSKSLSNITNFSNQQDRRIVVFKSLNNNQNNTFSIQNNIDFNPVFSTLQQLSDNFKVNQKYSEVLTFSLLGNVLFNQEQFEIEESLTLGIQHSATLVNETIIGSALSIGSILSQVIGNQSIFSLETNFNLQPDFNLQSNLNMFSGLNLSFTSSSLFNGNLSTHSELSLSLTLDSIMDRGLAYEKSLLFENQLSINTLASYIIASAISLGINLTDLGSTTHEIAENLVLNTNLSFLGVVDFPDVDIITIINGTFKSAKLKDTLIQSIADNLKFVSQSFSNNPNSGGMSNDSFR